MRRVQGVLKVRGVRGAKGAKVRRVRVTLALAAAAFVASMAVVLTAQAPAAPAAGRPAAAAQAAGADAHIAAITQYCVACHNDRAKTAGVSFQGMTAESVGQHAEVYEKAVRKMRGRVMPPPGARQPDSATADAVIAWLETTLDRAASQSHMRDTVVLHRLNRK